MKNTHIILGSSLKRQAKHTQWIADDVESLTDYSKINGKIVLRFKGLSDQFKTEKAEKSFVTQYKKIV